MYALFVIEITKLQSCNYTAVNNSVDYLIPIPNPQRAGMWGTCVNCKLQNPGALKTM